MELIEKIVKSRKYNKVMNILIIISVLYIIIEKMLYLDSLPAKILENIDFFILGIFAIDFMLRFLNGKSDYFFKQYGWIDFLATIPLLTPAIKSFRFFRTFRTSRMLRFIRILRVMRIMKAVKNNSSPVSLTNRNFFLPVSSIMMILMILFGSLLIFNYTEIYAKIDDQRETSLLLQAAGLNSKEEKESFLIASKTVLEIVNVSEIETIEDYSKQGYRQEDIYKRRFENTYVMFSRKETNKKINFFESILYISIFCTTILLLLIITVIMEVKLRLKVRKLNVLLKNKAENRTKTAGTSEELTKLEELVKKYNNILR